MKEEQKFQQLCNIGTSTMGIEAKSLAWKTRRKEIQVVRSAVAVIGMKELKTHKNVIAKELNRHRSLIYHYEKTHSANYSTYPLYRECYNKVFTAFSDKHYDFKVFPDLKEFEKHIIKNGIRNSIDHQASVLVSTGKLTINFQFSYRDFNEQMELIKLALQDYKYTYQVTNKDE